VTRSERRGVAIGKEAGMAAVDRPRPAEQECLVIADREVAENDPLSTP
jgi:hypothetical protein